ncbi:MAG: SMC-Scp complex subunit ScpB [Gammaproteobacteria bacterium]|nr:SMC-Scp complex subunit ScpB [Gammaproteobacteria bacterium]
MDKIKLKNVVEAILLASDRILSLSHLEKMLSERSTEQKADSSEPQAAVNVAANDTVHTADQAAAPETVADDNAESIADTKDQSQETPESVNLKRAIVDVISSLQQDYSGRAMELKEVASGYRFQVRQGYADYVGKLWEEKPSKYSRALLETLVLIAYRQPITRGEIEAIRGVSVSSHIIKTLVEREWVRVVGHRDVPGKPAIYGSTREFLDYFNLTSLDQLPSLAEIKDLDKIAPELALEQKTEELATAIINEQVITDDENSSESGKSSNFDSPRKIKVRRMRRIRRVALQKNKNA